MRLPVVSRRRYDAALAQVAQHEAWRRRYGWSTRDPEAAEQSVMARVEVVREAINEVARMAVDLREQTQQVRNEQRKP